MRTPKFVIAGGALLLVATGTYGYVSVSSIGQGRLDTHPAGSVARFVPTGSFLGNIYTTADSAGFPMSCSVRTEDGTAVGLSDARPYNVNSDYHVQAAYSFDVRSGTPYLVQCGNPGDQGLFALVEVSVVPQATAIVGGTVGAATIVVGLILLMIRRRRSPSVRPLRSAA